MIERHRALQKVARVAGKQSRGRPAGAASVRQDDAGLPTTYFCACISALSLEKYEEL